MTNVLDKAIAGQKLADKLMKDMANSHEFDLPGTGTTGEWKQAPSGVWHHIAVVNDKHSPDGLRSKVYLDGKLTMTSSLPLTADRVTLPDTSAPD